MVKLFMPKLLSVGCWNIEGLYEKVNGIKVCKLDDETFRNILKKDAFLDFQVADPAPTIHHPPPSSTIRQYKKVGTHCTPEVAVFRAKYWTA